MNSFETTLSEFKLTIDSVEEYTKTQFQRKGVELLGIHRLEYCVNARPKSAFKDKKQTSVVFFS